MNGSLRRCAAVAVAAVLIWPQTCRPSPAVALGLRLPTTARHAVAAAATGLVPPQRVVILEPPRRTPRPLPPAAGFHAVVSPAIHSTSGKPLAGPPMLRPSEIDHVLTAARAQAKQRSVQRAVSPPTPRVVAPGRAPGVGASAKGQVRTTRSVQAPSGTGINRWWRYQEETLPGGGHMMVNVGTGNVLIQDDDMVVPHKGISLTFRRTYNSQSLHTVAGGGLEDAGNGWAGPGLYGNGWTNTFDAHTVSISPTQESVYDVDGARYDYTLPTDPAQWVSGMIATSVTPGNHTALIYDGACGWLWEKLSGTVYYFYTNNPAQNCPSLGTLGAYSGRLRQIIGRNRYITLTFSYSWENGDASLATGKVHAVSAQTESGMTATLAFAGVAGHQLLQSITFPDGVTSVTYGYDGAGNLISVSHPPNNATGTQPQQTYGYQALGTGSVLYWAYSPRLNASIPFGSDGSFLAFLFTGTNQATATLSEIAHWAFVNPTIADGSNSPVLQPGYPTGGTYYQYEYYTTGVSTPTLRDTDGHATNWVVDSQGRPTQTQACTAVVNQACIGIYLITNESWDAYNNLVSEVDPRGAETDYAYDVDGSTVAIAAPAPTQGAFRPTSLYTYGAYDNLMAYCDPIATHTLQADWTSPPTGPVPVGSGQCATQSTVATRYQWTYPSWEPFGELTSSTSPATSAAPNGYQRTYAYDAGPQGGLDYGLPTRVTGAAISQNDASTPVRQPQQSFWYDANGNLVCYGTGSGRWLLGYDALERLTSTADPDDSSSGSGVCAKTGAQPNWNTTTRTTYFPDGAVASKQSASQIAAGVSTLFSYDLDGNEATETHHYGCLTTANCTAGVTKKFYDGADRLVEVSLPYDAYDIQGYPMMTRYIYDLSAGHTTQYQGLNLQGYGNPVKTQELLSGTVITPFTYATYSSFVPYPLSSGTWTDVRATSFDGLDRALSSYEAAFANQPKLTNTYDAPPPAGGAAQLGLLSSVTLATNEVKQYTYDAIGRLTDTTYANDNGATSPVHVRYDASGRVVSRGTDALGNEVLQYDAAGELTSVTKPASLGSATITYDYYSDGMRKDLNFASAVYTASPLYQYSYRADGRRSSLKLNNGSAFTWSYTLAGRLQSQSDPHTGRTIAPDNGYTVGQSQRQHPYYPSSLTYVSETYSFDNFGRTVGVTLPEGVFSQGTTGFDLDDGVTGMTGLSVQAPTNVTTVTCATSNVRNEKLPTNQGSCGGLFFNGATFAIQQSAAPGSLDGFGVAPWTLDARAGMLKNWQGPTESNGNASSGQFSYDASGRLTGDTEQLDRAWRSGDGTMPGDRVYSTGTRTKTYDAENRLRSQQTSPATGASFPLWGESNPGGYWNDVGQGALFELQAIDYSADSHPVRFTATRTPDAAIPPSPQTLVWLWDGNDVLAQCQYDNTTTTRCASYGFPVEGLADYYPPSNGYVGVHDRGLTGQVVSAHDAAGFTGMKPVGRNARNYFFSGVNATGAPSSGDSTIVGVPSIITGTKIALDGWTLDNNTWQGVRTYDASVGQWNTPDAYAGDVHDPMSQKPFMWNRNNPYAYSDPSGYEIGHIWRGWEGDNTPQGSPGLDWLLSQIVDAVGMALAAEVPGLRGGFGSAASRAARESVRLGSERSIAALTIHVAERHIVGGALTSGKGVYSKGTSIGDVARMIKQTVENGAHRVERRGDSVFEYDLGKTIGLDLNGNATSVLRAAFDSAGNLKSAYPIPK